MAKKANKKSAVSQAVQTARKAAASTARSTRKAMKKMMPGRTAKKKSPRFVRETRCVSLPYVKGGAHRGQDAAPALIRA